MQDIFIFERGYVHCCQWGVLGKDKNLANDPQEFLGSNSRCPCILHYVTFLAMVRHLARGITQCLCNTINIHRQVLQNSLPKKNSKAWEQSTINFLESLSVPNACPSSFLRFSYPQSLNVIPVCSLRRSQ